MTKQEKPYSQAEVIAAIMEIVENDGWDDNLSKRMVKDVLNATSQVAIEQLNKKGIGKVVIPGLNIKMELVRKPATKAHPGKNPFTGEDVIVAAKPARNVVKVRAMKKLKDAVL